MFDFIPFWIFVWHIEPVFFWRVMIAFCSVVKYLINHILWLNRNFLWYLFLLMSATLITIKKIHSMLWVTVMLASLKLSHHWKHMSSDLLGPAAVMRISESMSSPETSLVTCCSRCSCLQIGMPILLFD